MKISRWFRRQPAPPPAPSLTAHDALVKHAWGLTLTKWLALTDQERAHYRRDVTRAPHFQETP
ncbi:hypothetical protein AHiyo6_04080 [Arthrobacter sp. Hiyo6]|nr:hypothetical protein AHiyo6_04080 [Arthrobacter sp. Hiyo6]